MKTGKTPQKAALVLLQAQLTAILSLQEIGLALEKQTLLQVDLEISCTTQGEGQSVLLPACFNNKHKDLCTSPKP